ncbi:MAG: energy transducer TonB [Xanthobacteraceae bacterium]|nr:MAG: energy transducer TonB [Xanthobacteraceae bacterium]
MIDWRDPDGRSERAVTSRTLLRWSAAALAVLASHGAAVWIALNWRPSTAGEAPAAVMIDLAPLAVAPDAPRQDLAPGPQMTESQPEPAPDTPDKPVEKRNDEPDPVVKDNAAVTLPPPRQEEARKPKPQEAERKKPLKPKRPKAPQTTAPPASQAQRADRAAAPFASASETPSAAAAASWRGALMAHLNRYKRFPGAAASTGVVQVAFTIDRSGTVLSSRLMHSSGDAALDAEAVALPRRASPVPAPPAQLGGASLTLTVPIRFTR